MARPQLEDGHTQIANEILEHLAKFYLSPNQWQVVIFIIRKTYGYKKKVDYIANSQIIEGTGLSKYVISRVLRILEERNIINRSKKLIGFQKDWEQWRLPEQTTIKKVISIDNFEAKVTRTDNNEKLPEQTTELPEQTTELPEQTTKVARSRVTQKKKETIQKKLYKRNIEIPDWIDRELWDGFLEVRKQQKAAPTKYALSLIIKDLEKFKAAGDDPNDILKRSITNSWKGVFSLGKKGGDSGRTQATGTDRRYTKAPTDEQYRRSYPPGQRPPPK